MATGFTLLPPPAPPPLLEIYDSNVAEKWKTFCLAWSNYALATELNKKSEPVQVATPLTIFGEDARDVYSTLDWAHQANKNKLIELVLQHFADYTAKNALISGLRSQVRAMTNIKRCLENSASVKYGKDCYENLSLH